MSLFPFVSFDSIDLGEANFYLLDWGHRMGPLNRPFNGDVAHALRHEGRPVAVVTTSTLIRDHVGGGLGHLTRDNAIELSRLCAARPTLCRVALRLWREFVLADRIGISSQDADMHNGNIYRFDGWRRAGYQRAGGVDQRSGRKGRNRWIWVYPPEAANA